jgi:hypothetical protein
LTKAEDSAKELRQSKLKADIDLHSLRTQLEYKIENLMAQLSTKAKPDAIPNRPCFESFTQTEDVPVVDSQIEDVVQIFESTGCKKCEYYLDQYKTMSLSVQSMNAEQQRVVAGLKEELRATKKCLQEAKAYIELKEIKINDLNAIANQVTTSESKVSEDPQNEPEIEPGSLQFLKSLLETMNEHAEDLHHVTEAIPYVFVDTGTDPIEEFLVPIEAEIRELEITTAEISVQTEPIEPVVESSQKVIDDEDSESGSRAESPPRRDAKSRGNTNSRITIKSNKSNRPKTVDKSSELAKRPNNFNPEENQNQKPHQNRSSLDFTDFAGAIGSTLELGSVPSVENIYYRATSPLASLEIADDLSDVEIKKVLSDMEVKLLLLSDSERKILILILNILNRWLHCNKNIWKS